MSSRLYYDDCYLAHFSAAVAEVDSEGKRVRLGRSAFYPTSGGQPHDTGTIAGSRVVDVIDSGDTVEHVLEDIPSFRAGDEVACAIDWPRRFDHMQQHTGQHLLSAVIAERAGFETVSFHLGSEVSTIDLACPAIDADQLIDFERFVNEAVVENRRVSISFEDVGSASGLRKASDRAGTLRVVSIDGFDRSACGGTHVRATGEIGAILIRGVEKVRGNVRLEFVCGSRAIRRSRRDFATLEAVSRELGCASGDLPRVVASQAQRLAAAEKQRAKLSVELALLRGSELAAQQKDLYVAEHPSLSDEVRAEANGFVNAGGRVYIARCASPPSVLLACGANSGRNAGALLKPLLTEAGGRGGGSAQVAQGSLPGIEQLDRVIGQLQVVFSSAMVAPPPPSAGDAG